MVLNYNGLKWLRICLPSFEKSIPHNVSVYVIDNGSNDDSIKYVRSNFPKIKTLRLKRNLGFANAYNRAILQVNAEYVLLLNNDTRVLTRSCISRLVKRLESDHTVAACGCKLVKMDNHSILDSVGVMGIKYWRGFVDIGKDQYDLLQYDKPITPFAVCGAAMLIRRSAFIRVKGFDEKFYSYVEDVDLCWRLRLIGFSIVYEPTVKIAHFFSGSQSNPSIDIYKFYLSHRNTLRTIIKNCGSSITSAIGHYSLYTLLLTLGFLILQPLKAVAILKGLAWNLQNLGDTLTLRQEIETSRVTQDHEIRKLMFPSFARLQPHDSPDLRRIVNTLFHER